MCLLIIERRLLLPAPIDDNFIMSDLLLDVGSVPIGCEHVAMELPGTCHVRIAANCS